MKGTWRVVAGLVVFWFLILVYMSTSLYNSSDASERTERKLNQALQELEELKSQNKELQKLASDLRDIRMLPCKKTQDNSPSVSDKPVIEAPESISNTDSSPSREHEYLRRKIENGVVEFWYYISAELKKLKDGNKESPQVVTQIDNVLEVGVDHQRTVLTDLFNLSQSNGAGDWRRKEAKDLTNLVQNRLHFLQNPKDCSNAKKVVCSLNKGCGYGCQLHHLVYCMIIAYGTERTLILESKGWRYSPGGWEKMFLPLSDTCTDRNGESFRAWGSPQVIETIQVVELPIVDSLHPRPPYMPLAIPADLAPRLMKLHGQPSVWWIGQMLKYMLRPQPSLQAVMDEAKKKLGYMNPIVGVHVRRTDKVGTEAAFHGIDEYMVHVNNYYDLLEKRKPIDKRRIYLATDDPTVLAECKTKYPDYEVISDNEFSKSAGLGSRYSEESLKAIILDIHFLSISDYLVCTFSSQVCRVAYEIMQTLHPDASAFFHSLDDIYYYGGQNAHNVEVLYSHQGQGQEIDLQPGDLIGVAGNHWDGYSKGMNRRTGRSGLYPSYKVQDKIDIVKVPTYEKVDEQS